MHKTDFALGASCVALGGAVIPMAWQFSDGAGRAPVLFATVLALAGGVLLWRAIGGTGKASPFAWRPVLSLFGVLCLFALLLATVGFELAGFVTFLATNTLIQRRFRPATIIPAALFTAVIWAVFAWVLGVPLPSLASGTLFFGG